MTAFPTELDGATLDSGTDVSLARLIETVDEHEPTTFAELAGRLDLSEDYVSRRIRELKKDGVIHKAYVVDRDRVYDIAADISELHDRSDKERHRGTELLEYLDKLADTIEMQFQLAADCVRDGEQADDIYRLQRLADERFTSTLQTLKSYGLTTAWPGIRIAADLATLARDYRAIGEHCEFIVEAVPESDETTTSGICYETLCGAFADGILVGEQVEAVVLDADLDCLDDLRAMGRDIFEQLDELFEMASAYTIRTYEMLISVGRALERIVRTWLDIADLAASVHTGLTLE